MNVKVMLLRAPCPGAGGGIRGTGRAGPSTCTGHIASYLPRNGLIGEIGYGPYFALPNTSYLHVFQSGQLKLAVNTPYGAYSWGAFRVGVVALLS